MGLRGGNVRSNLSTIANNVTAKFQGGTAAAVKVVQGAASNSGNVLSNLFQAGASAVSSGANAKAALFQAGLANAGSIIKGAASLVVKGGQALKSRVQQNKQGRQLIQEIESAKLAEEQQGEDSQGNWFKNADGFTKMGIAVMVVSGVGIILLVIWMLKKKRR